MKIRSVVARMPGRWEREGGITKGQKETFAVDGYASYLYFGDGYTDVCIYQKLSNCML